MKAHSILSLLIAFNTSQAWSAGIIDPAKVTLETSPYSTCKDVKLLTQEEYQRHTDYWDKRCAGGEPIQILPKTGKFVTNIQDPIASLSLLLNVGEKAKKVIAEKIAEKEKVLKCLEAPDADRTCRGILKKELDTAYANLIELRIELALSEGKDPEMKGKIRGSGGHAEFPPASEMINSSLSKKFFGTVGVFRPDDLAPLALTEKIIAEQLIKQNIEDVQNNKSIDTESKKIAAFQQVRAAHKARYLELIQDSPVLTVLGNFPDRNDQAAVTKSFTKAYKELLKSAKTEQAKMNVAWDHASIEPAPVGSRAFRAKGENNRSKELLTFMTYAPVVDEVLKEQIKTNPNICAVATGLLKSMENSEFRSGLATGGAIVAGAVVVTVVTGGAAAIVMPEALPIIGGAALSSQTAVALAMGPGIGYLTRKDADRELASSKGALAGGVVDAQKVDQADAGVAIGKATMGLDFVGTGALKGTGSVIYKAIAKKSLMADGKITAAEAEKLITIARSTEPAKLQVAKEAQQKINESMNKNIRKIFTNDPGQQELEALSVLDNIGPANKDESLKDFFSRVQAISDKQEKKQALEEAIKLVKSLDPEKYKNATEQELKDLNKQVVAISRYGKVNDPEKIAALLSSWDKDAKNNLATVYDDAQKLLNNKNFMKGKSLKERRELAFMQELENKHVTDKKQAKIMCQCANVCSGSAKVSLNSIDEEKFKSVHVCAASNDTLWYIKTDRKI